MTAPASSLKNGTAGKTSRVSTGFGDYGPQQPAAGKVAADKTGRLAQAPDAARFGTNEALAPAGRTGLASALKTQSLPSNYGQDFAAKARASNKIADDRLSAWDGLTDTIKKAEAQRAVNPATGKVDPYNGLVGSKPGKRAPTHANLTDMTIAEVQSYQKGMIRAGHLSTALGAFQIKASTLDAAVKIAGMDPNKTKFTAATQDQLARTLADDVRAGRAARSRSGLTPASLASQLSSEWAGFSTAAGGTAYNDGVNKASTSYGKVLGVASNLVNSGAVGDARMAGTAPGPVSLSKTSRVASAAAPVAAPAQARAPISKDIREAAVRIGADPQATADYAAKMGMTPSAAAAAMRPASSYPGYKAPTYVGRDGKPVAAPAPAAQVAAAPSGPDPVRFGGTEPTRTVSTAFADKYLGSPTASTPTTTAARPSTPVTAKVERSLPDKVLAGAIDVGVGMVPGIGTAVGLYGLAAPMLGLPTVGDMALNLRDRNQFDLANSLAGRAPSKGGTEGERLMGSIAADKTEGAPAEATPPAIQTASFEEKYLGFSDPTPGPTPGQKWGGIGANSVSYSL